jgi:DNA (cytosine-5)-methyltransferase 1
MNGLDLFSGIGGIGLALEPWVRTVAYCEREPYAQGVLLSRMQSGEIDRAPIWDDVTTLRADMLPRIDIIFGGFPCQDLSVAGRGKGLAGERSGLFFEIARLIRECQPRFVFLENVPAIRTRGGERVVKELASLGYDCRWTTLSAASVGAPHKRERWFLLAHANGNTIRTEQEQRRQQGKTVFGYDGSEEFMAHAPSERIQGLRSSGEQEPGSHGEEGLPLRQGERPIQSDWSVEPDVLRVVNGLPNRAHRIKCLGNSVVPLQVREAFKKLAGIN